jgi:hypothetical protein
MLAIDEDAYSKKEDVLLSDESEPPSRWLPLVSALLLLLDRRCCEYRKSVACAFVGFIDL